MIRAVFNGPDQEPLLVNVDEGVQTTSTDPSPYTEKVFAPPLSLGSLPPIKKSDLEPSRFSPTSPGAPVYRTLSNPPEEAAELPETPTRAKTFQTSHPNILPSFAASSPSNKPEETTTTKEPTTPNQDNMGLFSAITGNIESPNKGVNRSNTVKTTDTVGTTKTAEVVPVGATGDGPVRALSPTGDRVVSPIEQETYEAPAIATGSVTGQSERAVTPGPRSASVVSNREPVAENRQSYEAEPIRDNVEAGVLTRPTLNDDQPSRSYLNKPPTIRNESIIERDPTVRNSIIERDPTIRNESVIEREPTIRNSIVERDPTIRNESILERAPAVVDRDSQGQPREIDYATASPTNLGDREHSVIVLPAGGGLHHHANDSKVNQESIGHHRNESVITNEKQNIGSGVSIADRNGNGTANGYPYEKTGPESSVRDLMNQGQAYREDGGVPGQVKHQQQQTYAQEGQHHHYPAVAGAGVAGAGLGAAAMGYRQDVHQQQPQTYPQQQEQQNYSQQQLNYPQQQQNYNDPSFARERAMSPASVQGMNTLTIQEPNQASSTVGPSPGPPVAAFKPTAPASPIRRTPPASNGTDLNRGPTYRSTVSRGSTVRRGGAFANGSALSGGGPAESYGRDDIRTRNDAANRNLIGAGKPGAAVSRKISSAERKDSKRMSKIIKQEGQSEAAAVRGAMKELESLQKVQKAAAYDELKAQKMHTKALQVHDKAYKKFMKQKEAYDRIESHLRSREEQYEMTRQHAQAQTDILAEKSEELNDLRAQKAADDREREMRLLALKNPGAF